MPYPNKLVAVAIDIDGLVNDPWFSDPLNTAGHSMILQNSVLPELNDIVLANASVLRNLE